MEVKYNKYISIAWVIFFMFLFTDLSAQSKQTLPEIEQSLKETFTVIASSRNDSEKIALNQKLNELMHLALANDSSFAYPFDSLQFLSKLCSDDEKVCIYTWNLPYNNGTFDYFGFIQHKQKNEYLVTSLTDRSKSIQLPEQAILKPENWYGALYYEIISLKVNKRKTYYTLLGWDGNNIFTNRKLIDVLCFKNESPYFGEYIFHNEAQTATRIIFEYAERASMSMHYDKRYDAIIFEHLAPTSPEYEGNFKFYAPDMTYDAFLSEKDKWIFHSNVKVKNP